jgi:hypothetical protein
VNDVVHNIDYNSADSNTERVFISKPDIYDISTASVGESHIVKTTDNLIKNTTIDETINNDESIKGLQKHIIDNLVDSDDDDDDDNDNVSTNETKYLEENTDIQEIYGLEDITNNLNIRTDKPNINLKKPNEVYYEIYKIAKEKAKQHKKAAITHYLEAKKIKNTYLLDSLDDSDNSSEYESDTDTDSIKNEIDEFVEQLE